MAKSFTATFVGLLIKEGKLDINKPGIVPEWSDRMDGSGQVNLDYLLRLTSGLDILEDQSGADPNSRMIFDETDAAGKFIGSSYAIANPHDLAKFGQLYLDKGIWNNGKLLPEGWVNYVTKSTPQSGNSSYGAGFWTVEKSDLDFLPKDTFYANGFQGQYVIVIPSHSLVIVRLGASLVPDGIWQFVKDVISAKQ